MYVVSGIPNTFTQAPMQPQVTANATHPANVEGRSPHTSAVRPVANSPA